MPDPGLTNRVVLLTGATCASGHAIARRFAAHGAWIAVNYRADLAGAKALVDELRAAGGRALPAPGDARTPEGAWRLARWIEDEWAQIDILVHAAALCPPEERAPEAAALLAELVPAMRARGWGRIVLCGDVPGAEQLMEQWSGRGVLVSAVEADLATPPEHVARVALLRGSAWNGIECGLQ